MIQSGKIRYTYEAPLRTCPDIDESSRRILTEDGPSIGWQYVSDTRTRVPAHLMSPQDNVNRKNELAMWSRSEQQLFMLDSQLVLANLPKLYDSQMKPLSCCIKKTKGYLYRDTLKKITLYDTALADCFHPSGKARHFTRGSVLVENALGHTPHEFGLGGFESF